MGERQLTIRDTVDEVAILVPETEPVLGGQGRALGHRGRAVVGRTAAVWLAVVGDELAVAIGVNMWR